jgi:hypothetical protein
MPFGTTEWRPDCAAYPERIDASYRTCGNVETERARGVETVFRRKDGDLCPVLAVEPPVVVPQRFNAFFTTRYRVGSAPPPIRAARLSSRRSMR